MFFVDQEVIRHQHVQVGRALRHQQHAEMIDARVQRDQDRWLAASQRNWASHLMQKQRYGHRGWGWGWDVDGVKEGGRDGGEYGMKEILSKLKVGSNLLVTTVCLSSLTFSYLH